MKTKVDAQSPGLVIFGSAIADGLPAAVGNIEGNLKTCRYCPEKAAVDKTWRPSEVELTD